MKNWTKEEDQFLIENYYNLEKEDLIKQLPNRTWMSILSRGRKTLDLERSKTHKGRGGWSEEENKIIRDHYVDDNRETLLALLKDRTWIAISNQANNLGFKRSLDHRRNSNLAKLLDESFEANYWAGYITADGYINHDTWQFSMRLSIKDESQIKKLSSFIENTNKLNYTELDSNRYIGIFAHNSDVLPKFCRKFGLLPQKTYNPPDYENIFKLSDNNFISFLIGLIDGDGCVVKNKTGPYRKIFIVAHKNWFKAFKVILQKISEVLNITCSHSNVVINSNDNALLTISDFEMVKALKKKISELGLDLVVLRRKWDLIDENSLTRTEQYNIKKKLIIDCYNSGEIVGSRIARKLNLEIGCVNKILKEYKLFKYDSLKSPATPLQ